MNKERSKRYKVTTLAVILLAATIWGTSCTVAPTENTKETTKTTQTTSTQETLKEITEADLEGLTLEELWKEYYRLRDEYAKECVIIKDLEKEVQRESFYLVEYNNRYNYLNEYADKNDKDVKKELNELEKNITKTKKVFDDLLAQCEQHKSYRTSTYGIMTVYYNYIQKLELEKYE